MPPDLLDRALDTLHGYSPEYRGRLANHGPMAAEALDAMGQAASIETFLAGYLSTLEPWTEGPPPEDASWRQAIGLPRAYTWLAPNLMARIESEGQEAVIKDLLPTLLSGLVGAAFHGLLRTGHAVRGLARRPSASRRRELAHALAYWTAAHAQLPGDPGTRPRPGTDALTVLRETKLVASEQRLAGQIAGRFAPLVGDEAFAEAVAAFDPQAQAPLEVIHQVAGFAAQHYAGSPSARDRFTFLHVVTASAALTNLFHHLDEPDARRASTALVHAAAAVKATHGHDQGPPRPSPPVDLASQPQRASASGNDHTIKLVEACHNLRRQTQDPVFATVAELALG